MIPVKSKFPPGWLTYPTGTVPRFHEFYDSLEALKVPAGSGRERITGPDMDVNRDEATRHMLSFKAPDWCLYLDDDQTFEPDALLELLDVMYTLDLDAITSFYTHKYPPFTPVLFHHFDPTNVDDTWFEKSRVTWEQLTVVRDDPLTARIPEMLIYWPKTESAPAVGLMRILCAGGGALLVRRRALEKIGGPWFVPYHDSQRHRYWGGDVGFGFRMAAANCPLYLWPSSPFGHAAPCVLTPVWNWKEYKWQVRFSFLERSFMLDLDAIKLDE